MQGGSPSNISCVSLLTMIRKFKVQDLEGPPTKQSARNEPTAFVLSLSATEIKIIAVIAAVYNIFCNFAAEETECDRLTFTGFMTLHSSVQSILKAL